MTTKTMSDYGRIGYGFDAVDGNVTQPIAQLTYSQKKIFPWHDDILIPDQVTFDPSPIRKFTGNRLNSKVLTARSLQINMMLDIGVTEWDPETNAYFTGEATAANSTFMQESTSKCKQFYEKKDCFSILAITNIDVSTSLLPQVKEALATCGTDKQLITSFFEIYGTHSLKKASVGGQLHLRTTFEIDAKLSRQMGKNEVDMYADAEDEDGNLINGSLNFSERDQKTKESYREHSFYEYFLVGGDITAKNSKDWQASLTDARIPTNDINVITMKLRHLGGSSIHVTPDPKNQYLGLFDNTYVPIYTTLGLTGAQLEAFKEAHKDYFKGKNPFLDIPQRLKPLVPESRVLKNGEKTTFEMKGWFFSYETIAGFEGLPGAETVVKCYDDVGLFAPSEANIYAGEVVSIRDATSYLAKYMQVECTGMLNDDSGIVYARNREV